MFLTNLTGIHKQSVVWDGHRLEGFDYCFAIVVTMVAVSNYLQLVFLLNRFQGKLLNEFISNV